MFANIIFNNKNLKIELEKDFRVRDLLKNLSDDQKYQIDIETNKETRMMDDSLRTLENEEIISVQPNIEKTFYLFQLSEFHKKQNSENSEQLEDLISKVTKGNKNSKLKKNIIIF